MAFHIFQICLIFHLFLLIFLLFPVVFGDYTFKYFSPDFDHVCNVRCFCVNSEGMKNLWLTNVSSVTGQGCVWQISQHSSRCKGPSVTNSAHAQRTSGWMGACFVESAWRAGAPWAPCSAGNLSHLWSLLRELLIPGAAGRSDLILRCSSYSPGLSWESGQEEKPGQHPQSWERV